jgi:hypothetical protein
VSEGPISKIHPDDHAVLVARIEHERAQLLKLQTALDRLLAELGSPPLP